MFTENGPLPKEKMSKGVPFPGGYNRALVPRFTVNCMSASLVVSVITTGVVHANLATSLSAAALVDRIGRYR